MEFGHHIDWLREFDVALQNPNQIPEPLRQKIAETCRRILQQNPGSEMAPQILQKMGPIHKVTEHSVEQSSHLLPFEIDQESLQNSGSTLSVKEVENILNNILRIQERWKECCELAGLHPTFTNPLRIQFGPNLGVERKSGQEFGGKKRTPNGDRYSMVYECVKPYEILKLNPNQLMQLRANDPDHADFATIIHEFWHILLSKHPKESAEWLAELGCNIYATAHKRSWNFVCDKYQFLESEPRGFYLATLADTNNYRNFHKAIGWAGATALLQGLGRDKMEQMKNFPKLAAASFLAPNADAKHPIPKIQDMGFTRLPTMQEWLEEINNSIPDFAQYIQGHDVMRPTPDRDTLMAFYPQSRDGCWLMRYHLRRNPDYLSTTVPHGSASPEARTIDRRLDLGYTEAPINFTIRSDAGDTFECDTGDRGRVYVYSQGVRTLFQKENLRINNEYWIDITNLYGELKTLGPFPVSEKIEES